MSDEKEQGFNDNELQDIMNEIESLEKEYETGSEQKSMINEIEETLAQESEKTNVVLIDEAPINEEDQRVLKSYSEEVNFNMSFDISGDNVDLNFNGANLEINYNGMKLIINEKDGCIVNMRGGVKFNVPVSKKKYAA